MKNEQHDEQIQKMLDQGVIQKNLESEGDVKAYEALYQALRQEPELNIPLSFSERVASKTLHLQQQKARSKARRQSVLTLGVIALSLLISLFSLRYAYPPFFAYMLSHKVVVAFVVTMFAAIQLADHWLIRRRWHVRL